MMKRTLRILVATLTVSAVLAAGGTAMAAPCLVEYKAKKDKPLRLNFGTAELPAKACASKKAAASALAPILAQQGWTLLAIVSILGGENPN
ncbi:MAG: hypothetical protein R3E44_00875 [Paracoccaceae bacterium]